MAWCIILVLVRVKILTVTNVHGPVLYNASIHSHVHVHVHVQYTIATDNTCQVVICIRLIVCPMYTCICLCCPLLLLALSLVHLLLNCSLQ